MKSSSKHKQNIVCKKCGSSKTVKNGFVRNQQRFRCNDCKLNFIEGDARRKPRKQIHAFFMVLLYSMGKASIRFLAKLLSVSPSTVLRWLKEEAADIEDVVIPENIKAVEIDEMWHFVGKKKNKKWLLKAIDRSTNKIVAFVWGGRNKETVKRLLKQFARCPNCVFYTDNWNAFGAVIPKERHIIGKKHTIRSEQNNSNTRHYLARMTRKTKVVSRCEDMLYVSIKLWVYLSDSERFNSYCEQFANILNNAELNRTEPVYL